MRNSQITKTSLLGFMLLALFALQPTHLFAQRSNSINITNGKTKVNFRNNDFRIEYEGDITISDDDKDIIAISKRGYIEISKREFGKKHRLIIEPDGNGGLKRKYHEGYTEKNFFPDGKAWLAKVLPEVLRSTTIGAESRVERFYKKGGAKAVLNEIEEMDSDYVKAAYFKLLLNKPLNTNQLTSVIKAAGNEINSDYYLANDQTVTAYINATKSIQSDYYVASVIKKVINVASITDSQMERLLDISKGIQSDYYITEVLTEIMDNRTLNAQNVSKVIELSKSIGSDHYRTQVLKKVIADKGLSKSAYDAFLGTLNHIKSDHYTTVVISELLNTKFDSSSNKLNGLLSLIESNVNSGHYASNIYKKIARINLPDDQLIAALNSASNSIRSDHYLTETLLAFSNQVNRSSEKVKSAYRSAIKSINSDTYYGRASKAID